MTRRLIVNADDFGATNGVNRGIVEAHEKGIVTSASLMIRQPAVDDAIELATAHPRLAVGLHVDLGEWAYRNGDWHAVYEVVDTDDVDGVHDEVAKQVGRFEELVGRSPTHLDSHQHVHQRGPAADAVAAAGRRLSVPVRHADDSVRYLGSFYGQLAKGEPWRDVLTIDGLVGLLRPLPEGTTELGCHPGYADGLAETGTMYVAEREVELQVLCDPAVRAALDDLGIELISFADLR